MKIEAKSFCQHLSEEYSISLLPNQMKIKAVAFKFKHTCQINAIYTSGIKEQNI